ncbi:tRNA nucleotidyltransferase (CCA-adding enzyme) [Anoxybacillus calidus]|jgi:tRNA nucleotidyltransferase (CCA-adding enzyme)|uniref:CCA-adding enzyme n=1 Tax=[Anoxybacillus] calidus TaxID=575178 RepID=A0A7W0BTX3_9BACL|nr:CCA tRNA nucleotidyltransferase [Anoxybacillus calidus]MBA2870203.1 tRNA nucleotidyltransferase (CCA-adding enzyme) [Anoxybacillus calidus]
MKQPFAKALHIIKQLKAHGHDAYFVGGAVRDFLLRRPIGDVDIATSALPEEVMRIFPKTIGVGVEHGTVMVLHEGTSYEVTTFRTEGKYEDYRRPQSVTFVRSLHEDLKRRDFTMNAIAMDEHGQMIDPFAGQEAIQMKIIRTVGDAKERFSEDALRMMRALRFVSQLGFYLSEETKEAIQELAPLLAHISVERITVEFEKLLQGAYSQEALSLLVETNLYKYMPGLCEKRAQLEQLAAHNWTLLTERAEYWGLFAYLLDVQQTLIPFLRLWKLPNQLIKDVQAILNILGEIKQNNDWTKEKLYRYGLTHALSAEKIRSLLSGEKIDINMAKLRQLFDSLPIKERKELAINGNDLMRWFNKRGGPWVAEMLTLVENAIISGEIENNDEQIKEWLAQCNRKLEENY